MQKNAHMGPYENLKSLWQLRLDDLINVFDSLHVKLDNIRPGDIFFMFLEHLCPIEDIFDGYCQDNPLLSKTFLGKKCNACQQITIDEVPVFDLATIVTCSTNKKDPNILDSIINIKGRRVCVYPTICCSNQSLGKKEQFIELGSKLLIIMNSQEIYFNRSRVQQYHYEIRLQIEIPTHKKKLLYVLKACIIKEGNHYITILKRKKLWFLVGRKVKSQIDPLEYIYPGKDNLFFYELVNDK